jgi:hypothetical protein
LSVTLRPKGNRVFHLGVLPSPGPKYPETKRHSTISKTGLFNKYKDSGDTDLNWNYQGPFAYVNIGIGKVAK